jgi:hypothetical protein
MDISARSRSFKMPPIEGSQNVRRARRLDEQKRVSTLDLDPQPISESSLTTSVKEE